MPTRPRFVAVIGRAQVVGWAAAAALANDQHGVVSRRQLRSLGLSDRQIDHAIATGRLYPVHRGVLALGYPRLTGLGRWSAAVLACGPGAALGGRSGAALWQLRPSSARRTEVVVPSRTRPQHRDVLPRCHPGMRPDEVTSRDGIPVTTVARTLLDIAAIVPPDPLRRAVSQAEVLRCFDLGAVHEMLWRHPRHRGARALGHVLRSWEEPDRLRSVLELAFVDLCRRHGLPRPLMNGEVAGREIDALFPDHGIAVELDSRGFHVGVLRREDDYAKRAVLEASGWRFVAFTYRQVVDDHGTFPAMILGRMLGSRLA